MIFSTKLCRFEYENNRKAHLWDVKFREPLMSYQTHDNVIYLWMKTSIASCYGFPCWSSSCAFFIMLTFWYWFKAFEKHWVCPVSKIINSELVWATSWSVLFLLHHSISCYHLHYSSCKHLFPDQRLFFLPLMLPTNRKLQTSLSWKLWILVITNYNALTTVTPLINSKHTSLQNFTRSMITHLLNNNTNSVY